MGPLGEIFNPGIRHEREERQARASRREEEGNGRDGDDVRIDLESGVAVIDPAASAARENAAAQIRAEKERRVAAARRKAQRRAASRDDAASDSPADEDSADDKVSTGLSPRTKAARSTT